MTYVSFILFIYPTTNTYISAEAPMPKLTWYLKRIAPLLDDPRMRLRTRPKHAEPEV